MVVVRFLPTGSYTEYPTSLPPAWITAGPDGDVWFSEDCANCSDNVGRLTGSGELTEYPMPGSQYSVQGITSGPEEAVWLAQGFPGTIWRMTASGEFHSYSVPPPPEWGTVGPRTIAEGPDGALWFTENACRTTCISQIGRISPSGAVTEYPTPHPTSVVAAGPDGALWYTNGYPINSIGRIATDGTVTEYPIPTPNSDPGDITLGPDGALWFTETLGNKIGRITTTGEISEFAVPTPNSRPAGITPGPDGGLWFTETASNKIGRIGDRELATLTCAPTTIAVGKPSLCGIRVFGASTGGAPAQGRVTFSTDGEGYFGSGSECTLSPTTATSSECSVSFTPAGASSGQQTLSADYGGDDTHEAANVSTTLGIGDPTTAQLACKPTDDPIYAATACRVTITDMAKTPHVPSGSVTLSTAGGGTFSPAPECTLVPLSSRAARCTVKYTPTADVDQSTLLTVRYEGDGAVSGGASTALIGVVPRSTATAVSCMPELVAVAGTTSCVVKVKDKSAGGKRPPAGGVVWTSDSPGFFSAGGECDLVAATSSVSRCTVTYTPLAVGSGVHKLTASYSGDEIHSASAGSRAIAVH
jgi:virginiamycin B lyase